MFFFLPTAPSTSPVPNPVMQSGQEHARQFFKLRITFFLNKWHGSLKTASMQAPNHVQKAQVRGGTLAAISHGQFA